MKRNIITIKITMLAILFIGFALSTSCTDEDGARKTLARNNYKVIEVGGHGWFCGGKEDVYITKFRAIAPNGDTVTGCVTSGWFKGNTIRLDD
jgi:hypothetical protein